MKAHNIKDSIKEPEVILLRSFHGSFQGYLHPRFHARSNRVNREETEAKHGDSLKKLAKTTLLLISSKSNPLAPAADLATRKKDPVANLATRKKNPIANLATRKEACYGI